MNMHYAPVLQMLATSITLLAPLTAVSISQSLSSRTALEAMNQQPGALSVLRKTMILTLAINETSAIFALLTTLLIFMGSCTSVAEGLGYLGMAFAMAIPAIVVGYLSNFPIRNAIVSLARQPNLATKLTTLLLIVLTVPQTPVIFGFVMAIVIKQYIITGIPLAFGIKLLASGFALGFGAVGPSIGIFLLASQACYSIGIVKNLYERIISFIFISQAVIETPFLFALVLAFLIMFSSIDSWILAAPIAAVIISLATLTTGIGSGKIAQKACEQIAYNTEMTPTLSRTSLLGQTFVDTNVIYATLIALGILFLS